MAARRRYHGAMRPSLPKRDSAVVALVALIGAGIVAGVVVLDKNHYGWIALIVYLGVYWAIVRLDGRTKSRRSGPSARRP